LILAHADWSVDPRKRWIAVARGGTDGWRIAAPAPVGEVPSLLARLNVAAAGAPVVLGLDLALGLPRAYAERHASRVAADFPEFLRRLNERPEFFHVAASIDEVGPDRPFYPAQWRNGVTPPRHAHVAALGLQSAAGLFRACDLASANRPAAAPLFWTMGPKQVGKAALHAWRELLLPALTGEAPPRLWPFEGAVGHLIAPGRSVVCETYPAEAMRQLDLRLAGSKRRQADRATLARKLLHTMQALNAAPERRLAAETADGFGSDGAGEDRMDSVIGLLGMLNVLAGNRPDTAPADPWIARWEGWVLGQAAPAVLPEAEPFRRCAPPSPLQ
jgi:hypothetical protein